MFDLAAIVELYAARGDRYYGENVTQLAHATQCAAFAEASGAAPVLIAAGLLHDIGHLLEDGGDLPHEAQGAAALAKLFGPAVAAPVALHVAAKRYLCFVEPAYQATLSRASLMSLIEQGGTFDPAEARAFEAAPYAMAAVALRRWDDSGKRDDIDLPPFADFVPLLATLTNQH